MRIRNKICPFCNEKISTINHLKKCNPIVDDNTAIQLMIEKTFNCNVVDIINDYKKGLSLPDIKSKYGLSYKYTKQLLILFGESTRTISESCNQNRLKKCKQTVIDRYGVDNVSKSEKIKKKKIKTFISNYGVDNIFKTDGFTEYVNNKCIERYGKKRLTNPQKISEKRLNFSAEKWESIKSKTRKTIQEKYENGEFTDKYISSLEFIVSEVFDRNEIEYTTQKFIGGLSYDFHITNTNIIVEVNGDYWHANPIIYESDETINYANKGHIPVSDIWNRDLEKKNNAIEFGYTVLYIWESDINENIDYIDEFILLELLNYGR